MKITINILLSYLEDLNPTYTGSIERSYKFSKIRLLTKNTHWKPDTLYFAETDTLREYGSLLEEGTIILCHENFAADYPDDDCPFNLIQIPDDVPFLEICDKLNALFFNMVIWDSELNEISISRAGLQKMLDVSERFFTNPIYFITNSVLVPAITKNIPANDPDLIYAREHQTFSAEVIAEIMNSGKIVDSYEKDTLTYIPPGQHSCYTLVRTFPKNPMNIKAVFLFNLNTPPSDTEYDLMQILSDKAYEYMMSETIETSHPFTDELQDSILTSMIEGEAHPEEISAYKRFLNLDDEQSFRLFVITFRSPTKYQLSYTTRLLSELLPSFKRLNYKEKIVLLETINADKEGQLNYTLSQLNSILSISTAFCGVTRFTDIANLQRAYELANSAAELGAVLNPDEKIHDFSDYSTDYFLMATAKNVSLDMLYAKCLDDLIAYDKKHNQNNMDLLKIYLQNDRSISAVATEMHLHRNSVRYRVDKIEQILGKSLDDYNFRMQLLLSFEIFDLMKAFNSEETTEDMQNLVV